MCRVRTGVQTHRQRRKRRFGCRQTYGKHGKCRFGQRGNAVPAVDVVCDAGPGEYDAAGFQNEKHTKIGCFLFDIDNRIGTESKVEIAVSGQVYGIVRQRTPVSGRFGLPFCLRR